MWDTNGIEIKVTLIRHGKTYANEQKLYYGFSDIDLSNDGIDQLNMLKKQIKYEKANVFVTSGLKRTNQTLKILFGNVDYIEDESFKEMNFGDFELKSYENLKHNKDYLKWVENIEQNEIPNGETKKQFENRVINGFDNLIKNCIKNGIKDIVVVCHSGVISVIMMYLFNKENKNFYDWLPQCGRGYTIFFINKNKFYKKL